MELNPNMGTAPIQETENNNIPESPMAPIEPQPQIEMPAPEQPQGNAHGLSQVEMNDPNAIAVTVRDKATPIVVLFGPPACGKTMTLVRLTRYLRTKGYRVEPDRNFRPDWDKNYKEMCNNFPLMISSNDAAQSTQNISFMLVRVMDNTGRTVCQILEAPGEYYFSADNPLAPFPGYINSIKNSSARKIWCYMVEPNWNMADQAANYVLKINSLRTKSTDRTIFIFNKIDTTAFEFAPGRVNMKAARKEVEDLYPGIFANFRKKGIFGWSDNFDLVPFHTGDYSQKISGGYSYQEGPDEYPALLWNTIMKHVKG